MLEAQLPELPVNERKLREIAVFALPGKWVSVQCLRSGERGGWVAGGVGGEEFGEVCEQRALLQAAGDRG